MSTLLDSNLQPSSKEQNKGNRLDYWIKDRGGNGGECLEIMGAMGKFLRV